MKAVSKAKLKDELDTNANHTTNYQAPCQPDVFFLNSLLNKMKSKINVNIHIFLLVRNIIFPLFLLLFSPFFSQRSNVVANADICQKERGE